METALSSIAVDSGAPLYGADALAPSDDAQASAVRLRRLLADQYDFIWRSLRRLGVAEADTDDAAQEVFLVAARRLDVIAMGAERSFLFASALRIASTKRRGQRRRKEDGEDELEARASSGLDPERASMLLQARSVLDRILDDMDLELRSVFVLFEMEEQSAPAIAELLGLPVGTVNSRLRRARQLFSAAVLRLQAHDARRTGA